jgi:hypothetical protein
MKPDTANLSRAPKQPAMPICPDWMGNVVIERAGGGRSKT